MDWKFNYVAPIHLLTALICLVIIFLISRKKDNSGRISFMLMMLAATVWSLSLAFEIAATTVPTKILSSKFGYLGSMFVGVLFFNFTLIFTNKFIDKIRKITILLLLIPVFIIIMAFTNEYHYLIWTGFKTLPGENNILVYYHGILFWAAIIYSFTIMLIGDIILIISFINHPAKYKRQIWYIIIGGFCPFLTTMIYALRIFPVEGLDISAMGFIFAGIFIFIGLSQEQFLDLMPIARHILIEKMSDAVIMIDKAERIVDINPAGKEILNLDNKITGAFITEAIPNLKSFITDNNKLIEKRDEVYINKPVSKWLDAMVTPLTDKRNNYTGSLLVLRDITMKRGYEDQLHELNLQLIDSEQKLQDLNNQKDKLFSVIAHDLLNPFHIMIGYSEILAMDIEKMNFDEVKEITKHIMEAAESGNNILVNLLEWSRSQSDTLQIKKESLNLNALLQNIIRQVENSSKQKNISIKYDIITDDKVMADKNIITTVVRNLLTNAVKFSNKDSNIELSVRKTIENFSIAVKDNGVGIPKENIENIFRLDKKYTTKGTIGEQGTGLGLILCKDFVEKHGGTISIESTVGVGSIFTITIPHKA